MSALTVIIVNWNVRDLLRGCLTSVFEDLQRAGLSAVGTQRQRGDDDDDTLPEAEVFVVDNASADRSAEMVTEEFPAVRLISNHQNLGFGAANNQALVASAGENILFLNPDTVVRPGAISALLGFLTSNPRVACVGPRLLNPDGSTQSSRRTFPRLSTAFVESTILQRYFGGLQGVRNYYLESAPPDHPQEVDWLVGACLLVRRSALDSVGTFDERFFMYSEEMDLCYRFKKAGQEVWYDPAAEVVHVEAASSNQDLFHQNVNFHESRYRFFRKHSGATGALALRGFTFFTFLFQMVEEAAKLLLQPSKREMRLGRIRLYARVVKWYLSAS